MGCNQVKSQDTQQSKARTRTINKNNVPSKSVGSAAPMSMGTRPQSHLQDQLGKSYTDAREKEFDYFQHIIDKTASNFIDVYTTAAPLEEEYKVMRAKDYEKVKQLKIAKISAFDLPPSTLSTQDCLEILHHAAPSTSSYKDLLSEGGSQLSTAMKGMKVKDVGPVVIDFTTFDEQEVLTGDG